MTIPTADNMGETTAVPEGVPASSWQQVRSDESIQFQPVDLPKPPQREPNWLDAIFEFLADLLGPLGGLLASGWPVLKWVLLILAIGTVLWIALKVYKAQTRHLDSDSAIVSLDPTWAPTEAETQALLSDADALAAAGRFDEATHLLLLRSVGHISDSRPDWVRPSSTARELAALPNLSQPARRAFQLIAERVEQSMFALRELDKADWEAARSAYEDFALTRIDKGPVVS